MNSFTERFNNDLPALQEVMSIDDQKLESLKYLTLENENKSISSIKKVMTIVGTVIIALLVGVSTLFLIITTFDFDPDKMILLITLFTLVVFYLPGVFYKKNKELGYTLYALCLLIMTIVTNIALFSEEGMLVLLIPCYLFILVIPFIKYQSRALKVLILFSFELTLFLFLTYFFEEVHSLNHFDYICLIMMVVNIALYATSRLLKEHKMMGQPIITGSLKISCAFYFYLFFFILTFFYRNSDSKIMYYIYNGIFFVLTTGTLFYFLSKDIKHLKVIASIFWFAFLFYKYYDLFWKLFHKSIVLIILGLVFFVMALVLGKAKGVFHADEK